jgi:nucleotide-binding universal stress UspA family protein
MVVRGEPVSFPTRILLATDGSQEATLAAKTAADLATKSGSELHVLTVAPDTRDVDYMVGMPPAGSYAETLEAIEQETGRILEEQAKEISEGGGAVEETYVRIGEPPDRAIVHLSEDIGAGLIAMGSKGHGGVRRALMGSVSDSVVRHAHCPVLVIREGREEM